MPPKKVSKKPVVKKPATKALKLHIENKISDNLNPIKPTPKNPAQNPVDPKNNNVRYWLIKSEPDSRIDPVTKVDARFPLSELLKLKTEEWHGVRNHEAKNNMLNMRKGDLLLFYHSNTKVPGIVGLAKVENEAHPDSLQFDSKCGYYDAKSTKEAPKWWCIDVSFHRRFRAKISLQELRDNPNLQEMFLVKRGRLSVTPVKSEEYYEIIDMESKRPIKDDIDCEIDHKFIKE